MMMMKRVLPRLKGAGTPEGNPPPIIPLLMGGKLVLVAKRCVLFGDFAIAAMLKRIDVEEIKLLKYSRKKVRYIVGGVERNLMRSSPELQHTLILEIV
jgi:hypothetical protein